MKSKSPSIGISVIIPTYNAAAWLPKTIPRIEAALANAKVAAAEIIVVDDGSSDGSGEAAKKIKTKYPLRVIRQPNGGRFLARNNGANNAKYGYILFIDTRIYIEPNALKFIAAAIESDPSRKVWTSHVYLDKEANLYARFWDALTMIAWRKYFSNPRDYSYGLKEFDYYPKGTTCFFAPKPIIQDANKWFIKNSRDLKTSNDDTLLIRRIAESENININPRFSCIYHARTNFKQFVKHVYFRGKVFVDGFLRRDGNRFYWLIILFLVLTIAIPVLLVFWPKFILPLFLLGIFMWLAQAFFSAISRVSLKDTLALLILSPVFLLAYGAGIWSAFLNTYIFSNFKSGKVNP